METIYKSTNIRYRLLLAFLLLALSLPTIAWQLDGKTVILVVSKHREGDSEMDVLRERVKEVRQSLGYSTQSMPIVFMGFADSDTDRKYFDRLGFQAADSPVLAVVEWGNPARFGPKRIIGRGIVRKAGPDQVDFIAKSFQEAIDAPEPPVTTPLPLAQILDVVSVRFKPRGEPIYHSTAGIRLRNTKNLTLKDLTVRYYAKLPLETSWKLLAERKIESLPPGNFVSRDVVFDSRESTLLDTSGQAQDCLYRFEVNCGDETLVEEGNYDP